MKFDYYKLPAPNARQRWISRPLIPIRLYYHDRSSKVFALIDSGADQSLFNTEIARELGLNTELGAPQTFGGIAGEAITAYFHPIELQIIGMTEHIKLDVGFTDSPGVSAILGQADFFEHFKITFERYKERIEITPPKGGER